MAIPTKRLILCCDGTWMDSYDGYNKPTLIPYVPTGTLQVPSNVTRISRYLTKIGLDGKPQIIYYHSGVGTGFSIVDTIAGGLLGKGISENIREAYSFIAANYVPGDEIILIGFSRGAFTVRSVAGMIKAIGLLTRSGMSEFYPIFKDQENFRNENYNDIFPTLPFANKPRGKGAAEIYKRRLLDAGLTRVTDPDGMVIGVRAVAVWDTVGSLGIPNIPILSRFKLQKSANEYMFYDTNLSGTIKHAFQVLALDEHRAPFSPAVWERNNMQRTTIDLRQVWFPGAHSNAGGGYDDQSIANISLAWMMDQLASIGVAFQDEAIDLIAAESAAFYQNPVKPPMSLSGVFSRNADVQWARTDLYDKYKPIRPWGLGKIYESVTGMYTITGKICRTPGRYTRADPETGRPTDIPLTHTNERIHGCVRARLDLEGLDVDDKGLYKCHALLDNALWRLRQVKMAVNDPIPPSATWGGIPPSELGRDDRRWIWEYVGPEEMAPPDRVMVEENLGPYQRKLLRLTTDVQQGHPKRRRRRSRRRDSPHAGLDEKLAYDSSGKSESRRRHSQYNDPPARYEQNSSDRRRSYNGQPPQFDPRTEHIRGDGVVVDDHVARERRKESRTRSRPDSRYTRDSDTSNGERPVRKEKDEDRYRDDKRQ